LTNYERYIFLNGTISACYANTTLGFPCEQGNIPPLGVNATRVEDIQAAVKFARQHNLRLVVKNTGHDYLGRSSARNAFLIWTHYLKERSFNAAFVPEGAPANVSYQAVTLGSGVQWFEAYALAAENNRVVVGGISEKQSVGAAGGWIMGGGHSALAPRHGLGVDNVVQFTIVLSDGSHVTTNAYTRPDLFWALRGGGGGTFGIVTSATYQTHPELPLTLSFISTTFPPNTTEPALNVITELVKLQPVLSDQGWGGYAWFNNEFMVVAYLALEKSLQEANTTLAPFVQTTRDAVGDTDGSKVLVFSAPFDSFNAFLASPNSAPSGGPAAPSQEGGNVELASRLIPRKIAVEEPQRAAQILLSTNNVVGFNSVAGGAVSKPDPDSMALHPGWRSAVSHAWIAASWEDGADAATINGAIEQLRAETRILDQITTDSASYYNEGSRHEDDFKKTYFGPHYARLSKIKKEVDPTSLFLVTSGVGSENWDKPLVCRRS